MKKISAFVGFMVLVISGLTIYVFAQPTIRGVGRVPPVREIILLQGLSQEEGYREGVQVISQTANGTTLKNGTLKINMTDGSVREIPLLKVKKLWIETQ